MCNNCDRQVLQIKNFVYGQNDFILSLNRHLSLKPGWVLQQHQEYPEGPTRRHSEQWQGRVRHCTEGSSGRSLVRSSQTHYTPPPFRSWIPDLSCSRGQPDFRRAVTSVKWCRATGSRIWRRKVKRVFFVGKVTVLQNRRFYRTGRIATSGGIHSHRELSRDNGSCEKNGQGTTFSGIKQHRFATHFQSG